MLFSSNPTLETVTIPDQEDQGSSSWDWSHKKQKFSIKYSDSNEIRLTMKHKIWYSRFTKFECQNGDKISLTNIKLW